MKAAPNSSGNSGPATKGDIGQAKEAIARLHLSSRRARAIRLQKSWNPNIPARFCGAGFQPAADFNRPGRRKAELTTRRASLHRIQADPVPDCSQVRQRRRSRRPLLTRMTAPDRATMHPEQTSLHHGELRECSSCRTKPLFQPAIDKRCRVRLARETPPTPPRRFQERPTASSTMMKIPVSSAHFCLIFTIDEP
jgi:hypothetical protein